MTNLNLLQIEDTSTTGKNTRLTGKTGEDLAAMYLNRHGYRLVCANFKIPIGRNRRGAAVTGEIDLIALDDETVCFIEVKTRSSDDFASPLAAVDLRKQRQITRTARLYRKIFELRNVKFRYDVVGIVLHQDEKPQIELFKNFWTEDKFRNKNWHEDDFGFRRRQP